MDFLVEAFAVVGVFLAIDMIVGELPNRFHPLRWLGNVLGFVERKSGKSGNKTRYALGLLSYILIALLFLLPCIYATALVRHYFGTIAWILVTAVVLKLCSAVFSFRVHCEPIAKDLENGDIVAAAEKTQMIVSRKTEGMDEGQIASSCVETVSENFADSVASPGFYFGFFGILGCVLFRCANLMDAMWGYKNDRLGRIGWFPAKFDDVLGYIPSRLSVLFVALGALFVGGSFRGTFSGAGKWHSATASPNSGWPMGAFAGGMDVTMEKKGVYVMGDGPPATAADIPKSYGLLEISSTIFLFTFAALVSAVFGLGIQMYVENALLGLAGLL